MTYFTNGSGQFVVANILTSKQEVLGSLCWVLYVWNLDVLLLCVRAFSRQFDFLPKSKNMLHGLTSGFKWALWYECMCLGLCVSVMDWQTVPRLAPAGFENGWIFYQHLSHFYQFKSRLNIKSHLF